MRNPVGLGAAFYPEQHTAEERKALYDLLEKSGLKFVRFAEFTWNLLEPREGEYDFSFHDEVMRELEKRGIGVILGLPTATPPVWASEKYSFYPMDAEGRVTRFGSRRYVCQNSEDFRMLAGRLAAAMGRHYADWKNVIAWQVDNEIGHPFCYCPNCLKKFRQFCERKFGTVDRLNESVYAAFWGQGVERFDQFGFPRDFHNPAVERLYHQFFSESIVDCYGGLADILRANGVTAPISTNYMVPWYGYDHAAMAKRLDFCGGDYYFRYTPFGSDALATIIATAYMKSFKRNVHPGFLEFRGSKAMPGEVRLHTLAAIAAGADFVCYFRFDAPWGGKERNSSGIVRRAGCPGRAYPDIVRLTEETGRLSELLKESGTPERSQTAILYSWDSQYDFTDHPPLKQLGGSRDSGGAYALLESRLFRGLFMAGETPEFLPDCEDFSPYKLVIAPALSIISPELAGKIRDYVRSGGVFLLLPFSGLYNEDLMMVPEGCPARLQDVFQFKMVDFGACGPEQIALRSDVYPAFPVVWMEELIPDKDCAVTAWFESESPALRVPACTEASYGKGKACCWGTVPEADPGILAQWFRAFYGRMGLSLPNGDMPEGRYRLRRTFGKKSVVFLLDTQAGTIEYREE